MVDGLMTAYAMTSRRISGGKVMSWKNCSVRDDCLGDVRSMISRSGVFRRVGFVISTPCWAAIVVGFDDTDVLDWHRAAVNNACDEEVLSAMAKIVMACQQRCDIGTIGGT